MFEFAYSALADGAVHTLWCAWAQMFGKVPIWDYFAIQDTLLRVVTDNGGARHPRQDALPWLLLLRMMSGAGMIAQYKHLDYSLEFFVGLGIAIAMIVLDFIQFIAIQEEISVIIPVISVGTEDESTRQCLICWESDQFVGHLKCHRDHLFHGKCLAEMVESSPLNSRSCPLCKVEF